jgi:hypothetical protein
VIGVRAKEKDNVTAQPEATPSSTEKPTRTTKAAKTDRSPMAQRASAWTPDPRWAHSIEATAWLYFVAVCTTRPGYEVPPVAFALLAPIGIALAVWWSRRTWPDREFGDDVPRAMAWLCGSASVAAAAWLVAAGFLTPWRVVPVLLLIAIWFGVWYWILRTSAPRKAKEIADARDAALLARAEVTWNELLAAAGLRLKVAEVRPTRGGHVIGVEPTDIAKPVQFSELESKMGDLTVKASARLAQEGVTVTAGTIRAEETEVAHVHLIHVCTKQILRESIPFEPFDQGAGTIADPLDFALFEDGQQVTATFGGETGGTSGQIVGATGSGKSRVLNSLIGRIGECGDVLVGVVACAKLVPAVYPWIKPWVQGRSERPAIDFVAGQDPAQVMWMLGAIYQVLCEYNDSLSNESTISPTAAQPAVVLFVEEAGQMPRHGATVTTHDGQTVTFSTLIDMITAVCRSACVSLWLMNQNALFDAFGDRGPQIQRNTPYRICLKTMSASDGMNTLPGVGGKWGDTTRLRHNSMLVQPSIDEPRIMPAKAYNLGLPGPQPVEDIAIRNAARRPELAQRLADLLGEVWTDRWNAERLPELAAAAERDGLVWPEGRAEDAVDMELRKMLEQETVGDAEEQLPPTPTTPETPMPAGPLGLPDADADARELAEIAKRPAITLPEPLHAVMKLLRDPGAPTDFVSTRQLAIMLGRVPQDADDAEQKEAARKLGRELAAIDESIRTEQRDRRQGYAVALLHAVAAQIAKGGNR